MPKKIFTWSGIAFLVFFVATKPDAAAGVVDKIGGAIKNVATGFGDFFSQIAT